MQKNLMSAILLLMVATISLGYLQISGVDTGSYPQIMVFASMNVPDPENAKFYVIEGEKKYTAALSDVKAVMKKLSVDFIIVFDITGSMDDEIKSVKAKIKDFVDRVKSAGFDYRLSLVTFKDKIVKGDYGFTTDVETFKKWLSALSAEGGGDTPESALDALMYSMRLPVRKNCLKVLILVTDAPYHYKNDGSGLSRYTTEDVRDMMRKFGFILYSISPDSSAYKKLVDGLGRVFDIHSSGGICSILDKIADTVTSQIAIVYSSDEKRAGQKVLFKIEADYNGENGEKVFTACGSYIVPAIPKVENLTITAEGQAAVDPEKPENQAILMAREAAILDAKRSILESLDKVRIDKETTVKDAMMTSEKLKTEVKGIVYDGKVVSEDYSEEWGIYTVKVKADLRKIYDEILHKTRYQPRWDERILTARGIVAINKSIKPAGKAIILARRGAIAEAQANLLSMIKGIYIDAHTTVEDKMTESVEITAKIEGVLKGAIVIDEMKNHMSLKEIMEKGYYWVSMAVPLDDEGAKYLFEKYNKAPKENATILSAVKERKTKSEKTPEKEKIYRWLVINANGMKIKVTFSGYSLCSKDGRVVFTPALTSDKLPMDFDSSLESAIRKHSGAVIYKASEVDIDHARIVLDVDYSNLKKLLYDYGIGENGNITVVSDQLLTGAGGD